MHLRLLPEFGCFGSITGSGESDSGEMHWRAQIPSAGQGHAWKEDQKCNLRYAGASASRPENHSSTATDFAASNGPQTRRSVMAYIPQPQDLSDLQPTLPQQSFWGLLKAYS